MERGVCEFCMIIFHHKPRVVIPNEWKLRAEFPLCWWVALLVDLVDTLPSVN